MIARNFGRTVGVLMLFLVLGSQQILFGQPFLPDVEFDAVQFGEDDPAAADTDVGDAPAPPRARGFLPRLIQKATQPKSSKSDATADSAAPTATKQPAKPLPPRFIRLYLMDGSVISGELSVDEIRVATDFGTLTVPIAKIRSITPGLDSHPELSKQVNGLIESLGSDDYKAREQSHKDLLKLGLKVRILLTAHKDDENAERKRHIQQILAELTELAEDSEDLEEGDQSNQEWVRFDTVVTPKFTIVGKVSPSVFQITSKYGPLTINLGDVRKGERKQAGGLEPIFKKFTVAGTNLIQRSLKNSGIRVAKGDRISVTADGQIHLTPWGSNVVTGPDGTSNYGWYINNKIPIGTLVARVGNNGEVVKVGSKHTWNADRSGTLYFAFAMMAQYATQSFPGSFNVKVKVEPRQ